MRTSKVGRVLRLANPADSYVRRESLRFTREAELRADFVYRLVYPRQTPLRILKADPENAWPRHTLEYAGVSKIRSKRSLISYGRADIYFQLSEHLVRSVPKKL